MAFDNLVCCMANSHPPRAMSDKSFVNSALYTNGDKYHCLIAKFIEHCLNCCFERPVSLNMHKKYAILFWNCDNLMTPWISYLFVCTQMQYFLDLGFGLGQEWRERDCGWLQLEKQHRLINPWLCVLPNSIRANKPFRLSPNAMNNKQKFSKVS
jgi:hypothetical protein